MDLTAGTYNPNQKDLLHYHFLVDAQGHVHNGVYTIQDNENCVDGVYAAHTGGGNTGSIGIALCGMYGYKDRKNIGNYPLTARQLEAAWSLGAKLAKQYKLNLSDPMTIQTHYGFGQRNPKTSSAGKIDITFMPPYPNVPAKEIEPYFRTKVKWYYDRI